jgi:hypothetical protein
MTRKSAEKMTVVPDVILVSQNLTNGLYNVVADKEFLVNAIMEHVMMRCFLDDLDEDISDEGRMILYIEDFALFRIETNMTPCIQFTKKKPVLYPYELLKLVAKVRDDVALGDLKEISVTKIDAYMKDVLPASLKALRESINNFLDNVEAEE